MLTKKLKELLKSWAKKMKKHDKRMFQAEVTKKYFWWDIREVVKEMWWWAKSIKLWLNELRTWIYSVWNYKNSWRLKLEDKFENLEKNVEELIKNDIQADNKLQSTNKYCRITAREIRERLISEKWYNESDFAIRWISQMLNRLWYILKKT